MHLGKVGRTAFEVVTLELINMHKLTYINIWLGMFQVTKKRLEIVGLVGCVAQWAERRSLAGELTLSCARPAADG